MKRLFINALNPILILVFLLIGIESTHAISLDDETIAIVGNYIVSTNDFWAAYDRTREFYRNTRGNFSEEMEKQLNLKQKVLDSMIDNQILLMAAESMGVRISQQEIQKAITRDVAFMRNGRFDEQIYLNTLKLNRITPEQFNKSKREELTISKMSANGNTKDIVEGYKKKIKITVNWKLLSDLN